MKTRKLVIMFALGVAVSVYLGGTQAAAQTTTTSDKPPKPPKPPKSDDHGPHGDHGSVQVVGGLDPNFWMSNVPTTRTALATGVLTTGTGHVPCPEVQAEVFSVLDGLENLPALKVLSSTATGCAGTSSTIPVDIIGPRSDLVRRLTDAGAPSTEATALWYAITGILSQPRTGQLAEAVDRFNRLVMASPESFLANPPPSFLVIHAVLARLGVADTK